MRCEREKFQWDLLYPLAHCCDSGLDRTNMKIPSLLLCSLGPLLLCQCETVTSPSDNRPSLTESGLSPTERVRAEKNRPLSADPSDPMNKVRTADGAVGVSVLQF